MLSQGQDFQTQTTKIVVELIHFRYNSRII